MGKKCGAEGAALFELPSILQCKSNRIGIRILKLTAGRESAPEVGDGECRLRFDTFFQQRFDVPCGIVTIWVCCKRENNLIERIKIRCDEVLECAAANFLRCMLVGRKQGNGAAEDEVPPAVCVRTFDRCHIRIALDDHELACLAVCVRAD